MVQALRSTRVLLPDGVAPATVLVEGGRIRAIAAWGDSPENAPVHDYGNHLLLPGLVDPHVHINEPGRTEWEGYRSGSEAMVA